MDRHKQRKIMEVADAYRSGDLNRRQFLGKALGLGVSLSAAAAFMAACAPKKEESSQSAGSTSPTADTGSTGGDKAPAKPETTIRVLALAWPQSPVEQKLADELFTPQTGIKVVIESQGYTFNEQKALNEVATKSDYYDLYEYDSQWIGRYVSNGGLERLDTPEYLGAAGARIAYSDFYPEIAAVVGRYPTNDWKLSRDRDYASAESSPLYGLPWSNNCLGLFYNKEYFKAVGLVNSAGEPTPPQTWEEYREMAIVLRDKLGKEGVYPLGASGSPQGDYISMEFFPMMWAFGGELWNPNTRQAHGYVNSKETVEALTYFSDLYLKDKLYAPDTPNWDFDIKLTAMLQGKVAMAPQWTPLLSGLMELPDLSQVVGQYGYTVTPGRKAADGSIKRFAQFGCQGVGINGHSKNKAAAWQYMQWLLGKEIQQKLSEDGAAGFASSRHDLKDHVAGLTPSNKAFIDSVPLLRDFWNNEFYPELLNIQQVESNLAFSGRKSPADAMNSAAIGQQAVYDRMK